VTKLKFLVAFYIFIVLFMNKNNLSFWLLVFFSEHPTHLGISSNTYHTCTSATASRSSEAILINVATRERD
jgi:hypothetical protein